jgi:hypothetical protein
MITGRRLRVGGPYTIKLDRDINYVLHGKVETKGMDTLECSSL